MTTATTQTAHRAATGTDPLDLIDVDHVRFYVGNAKQSAFFYASAFGFQVEQIRDLISENGYTADEILPLVAPPEPDKPVRVFSTWAMKDDPSNPPFKTYTRGVLPGWLKDAMVAVGLDPRMGDDRTKFKNERMFQV